MPKYEEIKPEVQKVKPTEQPEVKIKHRRMNQKVRLTVLWKRLNFITIQVLIKKEYVDTENQPTYYLKAQGFTY